MIIVRNGKRTLFLDPEYGMLSFLTLCCLASGKGSANVASGVVCRACYREVSSVYGWCYAPNMGMAPDDAAREIARVLRVPFVEAQAAVQAADIHASLAALSRLRADGVDALLAGEGQ